jgi:CheY-like chemotaxis protein
VKTILLADDSITIQKVVELTFSDGDYRVFCVSNGAQALRKIPEVRPDIVLLDVVMPDKNGYEVCEALKADPATASIPVLLLTGTFEPFDRRRAEAAGARGHVTKPFESHTLVARVEETLEQAAAAPTAPSTPTGAVAGTAIAGVTTPAGMTAATEDHTPEAVMPPMAPPVDAPEQVAHPAFAAPDAAAGGAYLGFADLAIGEDEDQVVPDRYDDLGGSPAADRQAAAPDAGAPAPVPPTGQVAPSEMMEGFVSGYDMPPSRGRSPYPARDREEPLGTPPIEMAAADRNAAGSPGMSREPAATGDTAGGLTQETLDRLAEIVVRRMSERVVREIAWEVIPGVAEALVRRRIKELEDQDR